MLFNVISIGKTDGINSGYASVWVSQVRYRGASPKEFFRLLPLHLYPQVSFIIQGVGLDS